MDLSAVGEAVKSLKDRVGLQSFVSLSVSPHVSIQIYPRGLTKGSPLFIRAGRDDTFATMLAKAAAAWDAHVDQHRNETVRAMALAIIEITAAQGRCSDAALRMKFPDDEIKRHGAEAVRDANEIADKGPFKIDFSRGGNGAPHDDEAEHFPA